MRQLSSVFPSGFERLRHGAVLALCGAVYGTVLFVLAFAAAGAGHGTYLPLAIFGAPLSVLHVNVALFAVLVVWPLGGFILGASRRLLWPVLFLLVHLLAVGFILLLGNPFEPAQEQWRYLDAARRQVGGAIKTGWVIYVAGQAAAWGLIVVRRVWRPPTEASTAARPR